MIQHHAAFFIVIVACSVQACSAAVFEQPLVLDGENSKNQGSVNIGFGPMASIMQPKNNGYVTDYFLDLKLHFDLKNPLAASVTDVCLGMRMLRGGTNNEDISTCENNIRNFVSEGQKIKAKLESLEVELPFRGNYIIELALFHRGKILHNTIHNFTYGVAGDCKTMVENRRNYVLTEVEHNMRGKNPRDILQMHPSCYAWYGTNFNEYKGIDILSSASAFRGSFGVVSIVRSPYSGKILTSG